jgi:hypothetical protein
MGGFRGFADRARNVTRLDHDFRIDCQVVPQGLRARAIAGTPEPGIPAAPRLEPISAAQLVSTGSARIV